MKLTFEPLGRFIHEVDVRNTDLSVTNLMGVNLSKQLMPSVANIVGTDLSAYKVVKKRQFACKLMSVGRDACLPIALKTDENPIIISSAYYAFEVNDESELIPEYLLMCFLRPDFDRELWFKTGGDVRGGVTWEEFCNIRIPYCNLEEQKKIVNVYLTVKQRVEILKKENDVLFDCLIEIYKKHTENASSLTAVTLDDICNFQEGYVNPVQTEPSYFDGDINWLRAGDIQESYIISTERTLTKKGFDSAGVAAKLFNPGTIMITKSGSYIGRLGILDIYACGNRAVINIAPKKKEYFGYVYLYLKYRQNEISQMAVGSVQLNLYVPILQKLIIDIPDEETLVSFNRITEPFFSMIKTNCREIEKLDFIDKDFINTFATRSVV